MLQVLQGCNALFNRGMGGEQLANATRNTHRRHALGQFAGHHATQTRQGIHHGLFAAHQLGRTGIGPEFALAAEPGHDDRGHEAQHDIEHDSGDV